MSEIRLDRIHNKYVIIAPERLCRPNLDSNHKDNKPLSACPFCEGNEGLTPPELYAIRENEPNYGAWKTRVVPNLYKAVQVELEDRSKRDGMFESIPGVGAHEILIDTPCHDCDMSDLSKEEIENWLRSMIIRIDDLKKDKRLVHISIFKNSGFNAGSTQEHPHTQILVLPVMPKNDLDFLKRNMSYYSRHGRGELEDIVSNEIKAKKKVTRYKWRFYLFLPLCKRIPI